MVRPLNPFSPSFGVSPPLLAGRRAALSGFETVFGNVRSPNYATLVWGLRGTGKTVLLNAFEDRAAARGWLTVSSAGAMPSGLIEDIARKTTRLLDNFETERGRRPGRVVSGFSLGALSVQTEAASEADGPSTALRDFESVLADLGDLLAERGTGLLITIDELHAADVSEIRQFGGIFQLVSRRPERPIAFAGAALPELEDRLMTGAAATFLQRCNRHEIGNLAIPDAETALRSPIETAGAQIGDEALQLAAEVSGGQPYLIQLIGADMWDECADPVAGIAADDVERALDGSVRKFGEHVYAPLWRRLSDLDKRFLIAMLEDPGSASIADIGRRWRHDNRSLSRYRQRLLSAGLVTSVGRGRIAFVHAAVRGHVARQAIAEGWIETEESG